MSSAPVVRSPVPRTTAGLHLLEVRRRRRGVGVAVEAVAIVGGRQDEGEVDQSRALHDVVGDPVVGRRVDVLLEPRVRCQRDPDLGVVDHPVLGHDVAHAPDEHDAATQGGVEHRRRRDLRGVGVAVATHVVPGDGRHSLRRELFAVETVGHDPHSVLRPHRVHEVEVATRVGTRVPEFVVLRHDVGDDRVARVALTDVEARVGTPRRVGMVELAVLRVVRVDPVVTVAVRGEVRPAVAQYSVPEEPVLGVVTGGEVLHRDAVGTHDEHAVLALELTVEDGAVAIEPTNHDAVGGNRHALSVDARRHQHEVTRLRPVDRTLNGPRIRGHADGATRRAKRRRLVRAAADRRDRRRGRGVADPELPALPARRRAVQRAVIGEGAGVVEGVNVRLPWLQVAAAVRAPGAGRDVVGVAAVVDPPHRRAGRDVQRRGCEEVVADVDGHHLIDRPDVCRRGCRTCRDQRRGDQRGSNERREAAPNLAHRFGGAKRAAPTRPTCGRRSRCRPW